MAVEADEHKPVSNDGDAGHGGCNPRRQDGSGRRLHRAREFDRALVHRHRYLFHVEMITTGKVIGNPLFEGVVFDRSSGDVLRQRRPSPAANGRAIRLRISCDTQYPQLLEKIVSSLEQLLPENKVSRIRTKARCMGISVYSNHLEDMLGWKAKGGRKHHQKISIPEWICNEPRFAIACLRGLIETDGSIYRDQGYLRMMFSTVIPELASQVQTMIVDLGFRPRLYCVPQRSYGNGNKYHVRLCRDIYAFLDLVRPLKK